MSLRFNQRQLDALRSEAIEEGRYLERREQVRRSMDAAAARRPWYAPPVFSTWADAHEGTVLLATDDGYNFYKAACIESIERFDESLWVNYTMFAPRSGTGGRRVSPDGRIMVIGSTL